MQNIKYPVCYWQQVLAKLGPENPRHRHAAVVLVERLCIHGHSQMGSQSIEHSLGGGRCRVRIQ